jgi:hypothetical protein
LKRLYRRRDRGEERGDGWRRRGQMEVTQEEKEKKKERKKERKKHDKKEYIEFDTKG